MLSYFTFVKLYKHSLPKLKCNLIRNTDVDECKVGDDTCHVNAACNNTDGSYICSCNEGFTGDGITCQG